MIIVNLKKWIFKIKHRIVNMYYYFKLFKKKKKFCKP